MATARYRRVAQTEPEEQESNKKQRAEKIEKITAKIHAFLWVIASIGLIYLTDLFSIVQDNEKVNRYALNLAMFSFAVMVILFLYLCIWLPVVQKVNVNTVPWEIYCPNVIPSSTAAGVVFFISLVVAFWPSWGMLSPLFIGFLCIGAIFSAHFIPWPC